MKRMVIVSCIATLCCMEIANGEELVKINSKLAEVTTLDSGHKVKVKRIQDVRHRLTDDFTKTSRACPPFCIQPTKIDKSIKNIGELELLYFLKDEVSTHKGILIDTRLRSWFELETIPSSLNIPFSVIESADKSKIKKIFQVLGMRSKSDGSWDSSKARKLIIFDNGIWCAQANHFLPNMLKYGYPAEKILYYRAGLQGWKLLGLTTVVHKEIVKK